MNKSQVDFAERKAKEIFDKWNDGTGFIKPGTGYYDEVMSCIEDAVHCGIQIAIFGDIEVMEGEIVKNRILKTEL